MHNNDHPHVTPILSRALNARRPQQIGVGVRIVIVAYARRDPTDGVKQSWHSTVAWPSLGSRRAYTTMIIITSLSFFVCAPKRKAPTQKRGLCSWGGWFPGGSQVVHTRFPGSSQVVAMRSPGGSSLEKPWVAIRGGCKNVPKPLEILLPKAYSGQRWCPGGSQLVPRCFPGGSQVVAT